MNKEIIKKITAAQQLLNECLVLAGLTPEEAPRSVVGSKHKTLREIVKGKKFKNGQEQLAVIVGYHEIILGKPINKTDLESEWFSAKMLNKYNAEYFRRAKDIFFRINQDGMCILTQTGEDFFDEFTKD